MGRKKTYYYTCRTCSGYFETADKAQAYCRGCIQSGDYVAGCPPIPTPLQRSKWNASREAQRLLKEADSK